MSVTVRCSITKMFTKIGRIYFTRKLYRGHFRPVILYVDGGHVPEAIVFVMSARLLTRPKANIYILVKQRTVEINSKNKIRSNYGRSYFVTLCHLFDFKQNTGTLAIYFNAPHHPFPKFYFPATVLIYLAVYRTKFDVDLAKSPIYFPSHSNFRDILCSLEFLILFRFY